MALSNTITWSGPLQCHWLMLFNWFTSIKIEFRVCSLYMFMWRLFAGELDKKSRYPETQQHAFVPIVIYFASIGSAKSTNTISIGNSTSIICITLPVSQHLRNARCVLSQPRILWKLWVHVAKFFWQKIWQKIDAFCASADVKYETIFKSMVLAGSGGASRGWWDRETWSWMWNHSYRGGGVEEQGPRELLTKE